MIVTFNDQIEQFCKLVNKGIDAWVEAGKLLCKISEEDHGALEKISRTHAHLTIDILQSFERIGRGEIYPYLLVDGSPGSRKLIGLPYESQVKLYNGIVRVVDKRKAGYVEKRCKVRDLNAVQARTLFDGNRVRTIEEQKKFIENKATAKKRQYFNGNRNGWGDEAEPEAEESTHCDLDDEPKTELAKLLTVAHTALLDARTALAILKLDSDRDVHITRALQEIGHLRFALNENDL